MKNRKENGFTIIEVMIVLAIAGLILVVVLIAVPQLQRNQRNEARRATLARISTEISNYAGNNNGRVPTDATSLSSFVSRYLSDINIEDPSTGADFVVEKPAVAPTVGNVPGSAQGRVSYYDGYSCDGETIAAGTARSYAMWSQLEGGAVYCLDNL